MTANRSVWADASCSGDPDCESQRLGGRTREDNLFRHAVASSPAPARITLCPPRALVAPRRSASGDSREAERAGRMRLVTGERQELDVAGAVEDSLAAGGGYHGRRCPVRMVVVSQSHLAAGNSRLLPWGFSR
jgi:hypothetical protein